MKKKDFQHHIDLELRRRNYDITILSTGKQRKLPDFHNRYVKTNYVFEYVIDGKGQVRIDEQTYDVKKGDMILFPPNTLLETTGNNDDLLSYWWVDFNGSAVAYLLEQMGFNENKRVIHFGEEKIESLMAKIHKATKTNTLVNMLSAISGLFELFSLLISLNKGFFEQANSISVYVAKAVWYIESFYMQDITVDDIAEHVHLSRYYMTEIFSKQTGMSPIEYLIQHRIQQAKNMLTISNISITEVALSCGFNSPSNFAMQFKRITGITPTEYRKKNR